MQVPFRVHPAWPPELLGGVWETVSVEQVQAAQTGLTATVPRLSRHFVEEVCLPLSGWVAALREPKPFVVALGGPPGTGKSTLVQAVSRLLSELFGLSSAGFSLDDVYYTKAERLALARDVHPLLATRGVPGTHDLALAGNLLDRLNEATPDRSVLLPRFDKLGDDRAPPEDWIRVTHRPDVIFLDAWCWGRAAADPASLERPLNEREAEDDGDGSWRRYVAAQLAGPYRAFFRRAHAHVELEAPSWETTLDWRVEQQLALRGHGGTRPDQETRAQITHFLRLFERIARLPFATEPDLVLALDERRELLRLTGAATR
ncbi:MAG TPA: hypothetical protein VGK73_37720 [Polyangiaceae bacterium]